MVDLNQDIPITPKVTPKKAEEKKPEEKKPGDAKTEASNKT